MVNAWSLAASILDGTFDKDYPIMTEKTGNININTGVGNTVTYNVPLTHTNLDGDITIGSGSTMTYDQMVSAGYEMSGEGIWWPKDKEEETPDYNNPRVCAEIDSRGGDNRS